MQAVCQIGADCVFDQKYKEYNNLGKLPEKEYFAVGEAIPQGRENNSLFISTVHSEWSVLPHDLMVKQPDWKSRKRRWHFLLCLA